MEMSYTEWQFKNTLTPTQYNTDPFLIISHMRVSYIQRCNNIYHFFIDNQVLYDLSSFIPKLFLLIF